MTDYPPQPLNLRRAVESARGPRHPATPDRPAGYWAELEAATGGAAARVATLLLSAHECPLRCVYCDLWQHSLPAPTPRGALPQQIAWALQRLPGCAWIKLYNGGNFFDPRSVPPEDLENIASLCRGFQRVIIENHPRLWSASRAAAFAAQLGGQLEVAVGLETADDALLGRLNKQMTVADFEAFADRLATAGIDLRVFLIHGLSAGPKDASEAQTCASVEVAARAGARHISLVPLRPTRTLQVARLGVAAPPSVAEMEAVLMAAGRQVAHRTPRPIVTVDLWDFDRLPGCDACRSERRRRLELWNLRQEKPSEPVPCRRCQG